MSTTPSFGDFVEGMRKAPVHTRSAMFKPKNEPSAKSRAIAQGVEDDLVPPPPPPPESGSDNDQSPARHQKATTAPKYLASPAAALSPDSTLTPEKSYLPPEWALRNLLVSGDRATAAHLVPQQIENIPLQFSIDVIHNGGLFDSFDHAEGLWSPVDNPSSSSGSGSDAHATSKYYEDDTQRTSSTSKAAAVLSSRKRLLDAVNTALGPSSNQNKAGNLLSILASLCVGGGDSSGVDNKSNNRMNDYALCGKEQPNNNSNNSRRVIVTAEHPSTSRVHGVFQCGFPSRPKEDGGAPLAGHGLWYIDLGSANGSFLFVPAAEDEESQQNDEHQQQQEKKGGGGGRYVLLQPFVPYPIGDGTQLRLGQSQRTYTVRLKTVRNVYDDDDSRRVMRLREEQLLKQNQSVRMGFDALMNNSSTNNGDRKRPRTDTGGDPSQQHLVDHSSMQEAADECANKEETEVDPFDSVFSSMIDGGVGTNVSDDTLRRMPMEALERRQKKIEDGIILAVQSRPVVGAAVALNQMRGLERELMGVQSLVARKQALASLDRERSAASSSTSSAVASVFQSFRRGGGGGGAAPTMVIEEEL